MHGAPATKRYSELSIHKKKYGLQEHDSRSKDGLFRAAERKQSQSRVVHSECSFFFFSSSFCLLSCSCSCVLFRASNV